MSNKKILVVLALIVGFLFISVFIIDPLNKENPEVNTALEASKDSINSESSIFEFEILNSNRSALIWRINSEYVVNIYDQDSNVVLSQVAQKVEEDSKEAASYSVKFEGTDKKEETLILQPVGEGDKSLRIIFRGQSTQFFYTAHLTEYETSIDERSSEFLWDSVLIVIFLVLLAVGFTLLLSILKSQENGRSQISTPQEPVPSLPNRSSDYNKKVSDLERENQRLKQYKWNLEQENQALIYQVNQLQQNKNRYPSIDDGQTNSFPPKQSKQPSPSSSSPHYTVADYYNQFQAGRNQDFEVIAKVQLSREGLADAFSKGHLPSFEESRQGTFSIVRHVNSKSIYYLVLDKKARLIGPTIQNIEYSYEFDPASDLKTPKTVEYQELAIVISGSSNIWKLSKKGELKLCS